MRRRTTHPKTSSCDAYIRNIQLPNEEEEEQQTKSKTKKRKEKKKRTSKTNFFFLREKMGKGDVMVVPASEVEELR